MKTKISLLMTMIFVNLLLSCGDQEKRDSMALQAFIDEHVKTIRPLMKESAEAYFQASISGKEEDFQLYADLNIRLTKVYSDPAGFEQLKTWKEAGKIQDPMLKRQLDVLFIAFQKKQMDTLLLETIIKKEAEVENKYSNFRALVNGKTVSDNEVEEILSSSASDEEVKQAWLASKEIGPKVANDVKELVKLRNQSARLLGFSNFHQMSLQLSEQDAEAIEKLFDELDLLTRDRYLELKSMMDDHLARKFKIPISQLMPWHYQNRFFQEAPKMYSVDFDSYYKSQDIVALTRDYYAGIGLPLDAMLEKSDLFEKPGKNQHAFCIDIDNEGDVRVLCNVRPNYNWMNTMMHEYGHAVYDYYMPDSLPFVLREPAHTFTTEAIAMLFGRMASNPPWMQDMTGISEEEKNRISEAGFQSLRLEQLVFSRWSQVMYRFEKAMYEDPDQDLNALWWTLVEKYQGVKSPAGRNMPDWATKIHIASFPCYYHNYLLGELLASQLNSYISKDILKSEEIRNQSFARNVAVGDFLREKVFAVGALYPWDTMIEKATGEKLTAKYYARQFVE